MTVPFENDTGNIVRKLARKSLKSEKRRNLMVVIAVALASCLICFSIVMALSCLLYTSLWSLDYQSCF